MSDKLERLQAARAIAALSVAYFHSYIALRAFLSRPRFQSDRSKSGSISE